MRREMKRLAVWFSLLSLAVAVGGCGGAAATDRPATVPAGGTVTYKGAPLDGATVTLVPEPGGKAAVGKTDANGSFTLMTFEPGDGAVPGKYAVTVVKRTEAPAEVSENSEGPAAPPPKNLLPSKYASPATSGLNAEVTAEDENQFQFELTD